MHHFKLLAYPSAWALSIFTLYISFNYGFCGHKHNIHGYAGLNWDYLLFAQRWPPAVCLDMGQKCAIPKNVTEWIIHGLWPTDVNGYPSFCNSSWKFNPEDVEPILPELQEKWPNMMSGSSENSFWKHEWSKHGTCATSCEDLDGVLKYFNQSLVLHDSYNLYKLFKDSNILPDAEKPFLLYDVENALMSAIGKKPKLLCRKHKGYDYPLLDTIYICMSKTFELIDCDLNKETPCKGTYVSYIPFNNSLPAYSLHTEF